MALPAGRVGVKRTDVDWQGNVKGGGGSSDTYTKQQIDSKFGGLTFRDNEGTPQVKTSEGDWVNFNKGSIVDAFDASNIGSATSRADIYIKCPSHFSVSYEGSVFVEADERLLLINAPVYSYLRVTADENVQYDNANNIYTSENGAVFYVSSGSKIAYIEYILGGN